MKIHKAALLLLSAALFASGCTQQTPDDQDQITEIRPVISGEYGYVLDYEASDTRIVHNNYRASKFDPQTMGYLGQQLAKKYFDPNEYLVKEGQIVSALELERNETDGTARGLLKFKSAINSEGLNPERGVVISNGYGTNMYNPILVSDLYEIDYVKQDNGQYDYAGFTFIIVLNSYVSYREAEVDESGSAITDENGDIVLKSGSLTTQITKDQLYTYGSVEAGQRLVNYLRNNHPEVGSLPIHVVLYMAPAADSKTPGVVIGESYVTDRSSSYTPVNQEWVYFPSDNANAINGVIASQFNQMKQSLFQHFPTDVGLFGIGLFEDASLSKLELTVNMQAKTYVESQSLIQYMVQLCSLFTDTNYAIKVDIKSDDKTVALLSRQKGSSNIDIMLN